MRTPVFFICLFSLICSITDYALAQQYCIPDPVYSTQLDRYIDTVRLEDIEYSGTYYMPDTSYHDYTNYKTTLSTENTYILTITAGPSYLNMHYAAWIDYNQDGDFTDADEKLGEYITTSSGQTFDINFTVPDSAILKSTRLRVRAIYNVSDPDPCIDYTYGETEDYTVIITDFDKVNLGISGGYGKVHFLNYNNNDNDYDFIILDDISDSVLFYRDLSGTYTFYDIISGDFPNMINTSFAAADLNNNNRIDAIITGRLTPSNDPRSVLYINNGAFFVEKPDQLVNLKRGSSGCADLNNDGRKDIIIAGFDEDDYPRTLIYQNNIDSLILVAELPGLAYGNIKFADYDNDMDIDFFISGYDNYGSINGKIYRNDGDWTFTNINAKLPKFQNGSAVWADYNGDGLQDLAILSDELEIYKNNGDDNFIRVFHCLEFLDSYIEIKAIDIDNNGDLEILAAATNELLIFDFYGADSLLISDRIYIKGLTGFDVADVNYDKKPDILINTYGIYNMYMLYNKKQNNNLSPKTPGEPEAYPNTPEYNSVTLSWSASLDDKIPAASLTYNLRVGTSSGGSDIMSAEINTSDSCLLIPRHGNVYTNTSWIIKDLDPGTYYWSVQAIDNNFNCSDLSKQDTFEILPPLTQSSYLLYGGIIQDVPAVDLDTDNQLDLVLSYKDTIKIYRMNGGSFSVTDFQTDIDLLGVYDVNNDNLPDLVFNDRTDSIGVLINRSAGIFDKIILDSLYASEAAVYDFDNDGDKDILLIDNGIFIMECTDSLVYNTIKLDIGYIYYFRSTISVADFDNDNDLDFIISGQAYSSEDGNEYKTLVVENKGNLEFEISQVIYPGLGRLIRMTGGFYNYPTSPCIMLNDINSDGFIDFLISGTDSYESAITCMFINDGNGYFYYQESGVRPTVSSIPAWFDYNADGYIDVLYTLLGKKESVIYLNDANQNYYPFPTVVDSIERGWYIDHLDIDNDNDQDIILSIAVPKLPEGYNFVSTAFINNTNVENNPPDPPTETSYSQKNFDVTLNWNNGNDDLTNQDGMTYNIWVGTEKYKTDIVSPMSDLITGKRYINNVGNTGTNKSWLIKNITIGKYYWSVQAIDNSFQGGSWSSVDSFIILSISPDFTFKSNVCLGNPSQFVDLSATTDSIIKWYWDFGDGETDTVQHPVHTYETADTFTVTLTAYTLSGDSASKQNPVYIKPSPIARFSVDPVCLGESSEFVNLSEINDISVSLWRWNFGNGNISLIQGNVSQDYTETDTAWLTINAANGCSDADTQIVYIGRYPQVSLFLKSTDESDLCMGESSTIYINPYFEHKNNYLWEKNNVQILNTGDSMEVYTGGVYKVTAVDTVAFCQTTSNPVEINVVDPPGTPTIEITGDTVKCPYETVSLNVINSSGDYLYQWYKNGIPLSTEKNPSITGELPDGEYEVKAYVGGCDRLSRRVVIENLSAPEKPEIYVNDGPDLYYLSCTNTNAKSYKWYYNYQLIDYAHKFYFIAGDLLGTYYVEIEEEGKDCPMRSDLITIPYATTVNYINNDNIFQIIPNPNNGNFEIVLSDCNKKVKEIEILSLEGKLVFANKNTSFDKIYPVNITIPDKGIYLLRIITEDAIYIKKLLIK